MLGCYRKGEANDPEVYTGAIAATLAEFPRTVIEYVTDPRTGLPSSCSFLPTVKEARDACNARVRVLAMMAKPAFRIERLTPPPVPKKPGEMDWKEYQERFPGGRPIGRFESLKTEAKIATKLDPEKVKAELGATDAQWAEIPDAAGYDFTKLNARE